MMIRWTCLAVVVACVVPGSVAWGQGNPVRPRGFTDMVVFGDSLSDTGNSLALTTNVFNAATAFTSLLPFPANQTPVPGGIVRPRAPYYDPGRWTNGFSNNGATLSSSSIASLTLAPTAFDGVWHENLATLLGIPKATAVGAAGPYATTSANYAVGGAISTGGTVTTPDVGYGTFDTIRNVGYQVNTQYLGANPTVSPTTLFVIWSGGNDLRNTILDGLVDGGVDNLNNRTIVRRVMTTAVTALAGDIGVLARLANGGPINVLWPNIVPLDLIPDLQNSRNGSVTKRALAGYGAFEFDSQWRAAVASLRSQYPNLNLIDIDFYNFLLDYRNPANPLSGANSTDPIVEGGGILGFSAPVYSPSANSSLTGITTTPTVNPDSYIFWDNVHPTSRTHYVLGLFASDRIQAIPEPAVAGVVFAAMPVLARRRRRIA